MLHNKKGAALLQVLLITVVLAGMAAMLLRASLSRTTTARKTRRTVASQMLINTCQAEVSALWGIKSPARFSKDLENCWMNCSCTPEEELVYDIQQKIANSETVTDGEMIWYLTKMFSTNVADFCQSAGFTSDACNIAKNCGLDAAELYLRTEQIPGVCSTVSNPNAPSPCECQDGVTASRSYECSPVTVDGVTYTVTASFTGNKTPEEQCELKYTLDDGITTSTDVVL